MGRAFVLRFKKSRPKTIAACKYGVIASYELDHMFIQTYELVNDGYERKLAMSGTVLAINPTSGKVVPNFTSYGFAAVGVLMGDADCGDPGWAHDVEVNVMWRGLAIEERCWDNGVYGTVLGNTKDTLAERIDFVRDREKRNYRSQQSG